MLRTRPHAASSLGWVARLLLTDARHISRADDIRLLVVIPCATSGSCLPMSLSPLYLALALSLSLSLSLSLFFFFSLSLSLFLDFSLQFIFSVSSDHLQVVSLYLFPLCLRHPVPLFLSLSLSLTHSLTPPQLRVIV